MVLEKKTKMSKSESFGLIVWNTVCRDDYAKKYSNKVYIGMAVCKGRGDGIKHEVKHP